MEIFYTAGPSHTLFLQGKHIFSFMHLPVLAVIFLEFMFVGTMLVTELVHRAWLSDYTGKFMSTNLRKVVEWFSTCVHTLCTIGGFPSIYG